MMEINTDRFLGLIEQINRTMPRLAYTPAEELALQLIENNSLGYLYRDLFDNLILSPKIGMNRGSMITLGSHIDTVPTAGRLDGVLGTAAAVEIFQCLQESKHPLRHQVRVVIHRAEESARFGVGCLGSKLALGLIDPTEAFELIDNAGVKLGDAALVDLNHLQAFPSSEFRRATLAYLELHIEQGPVLEKQGKQIGIVTAIAAPTRVEYVFTGRPDHSGTTPMNMRRDALVAAATFVTHLSTLAQGWDFPTFRFTVGRFTIEPNAVNTVPSQVSLILDVRETNMGSRQQFLQRASRLAHALNQQCGLYYPHTDPDTCQVRETVLQEDEPQQMDERLCTTMEWRAQERGYPCTRMISGASHDAASYAAAGIPTGLIFVPSIGGRSHCPEEDTDEADLVAGAQLLCDTALALAQKE
jgi:N-carbamoyl-L-amino-acid hydrolase